MAKQAKYKRVLLKISGQSMCSEGGFGIEWAAVEGVVREIRPLVELGVQLGLVIGGGNFIRGRDLAANPDIHRVTADQMGMLATIVNAIALRDALESGGVPACVLSAIPVTSICEAFSSRQAIACLEGGRVVILAAGTGNPSFTTDTCAALRAGELEADVLFKATKVDGVFQADPVIDPKAERYDRLTYQQVLADRLGVMDLTAISMCMERRVPIVVFQLSKPGNLLRAAMGEPVGTIVSG